MNHKSVCRRRSPNHHHPYCGRETLPMTATSLQGFIWHSVERQDESARQHSFHNMLHSLEILWLHLTQIHHGPSAHRNTSTHGDISVKLNWYGDTRHARTKPTEHSVRSRQRVGTRLVCLVTHRVRSIAAGASNVHVTHLLVEA